MLPFQGQQVEGGVEGGNENLHGAGRLQDCRTSFLLLFYEPY